MSNIIENNTDPQYQTLVSDISSTFEQGRAKTKKAINAGLINTYWKVGQHIVEFEQQGEVSATYGGKLLESLSNDLKLRYGKGFSLSNLKRFRQFYLSNRNSATLSHQLSWSHYVELLKVSNETERSFYQNQTISARSPTQTKLRIS